MTIAVFIKASTVYKLSIYKKRSLFITQHNKATRMIPLKNLDTINIEGYIVLRRKIIKHLAINNIDVYFTDNYAITCSLVSNKQLNKSYQSRVFVQISLPSFSQKLSNWLDDSSQIAVQEYLKSSKYQLGSVDTIDKIILNSIFHYDNFTSSLGELILNHLQTIARQEIIKAFDNAGLSLSYSFDRITNNYDLNLIDRLAKIITVYYLIIFDNELHKHQKSFIDREFILISMAKNSYTLSSVAKDLYSQFILMLGVD